MKKCMHDMRPFPSFDENCKHDKRPFPSFDEKLLARLETISFIR
jgi:hypothetical protein